MQISKNNPTNRRAGFTLSEILLAMLVFAIAISTILALLARSIETVDEIVLKDEAMRLSSALENEMQNLSFTDIYNLLRNNPAPSGLVFHALHYRAGTDRVTPISDRSGVLGVNYFVVPFVAKDLPAGVFEAREGRLFGVRMVVSPTNPLGPNLNQEPEAYQSAAVVIYAEFFPLGVPGQTPSGTPVYSYNFAVRR